MAHFNFVISQNAKWWHAGFYIDRHRMTSPNMGTGKYCFTKKALSIVQLTVVCPLTPISRDTIYLYLVDRFQ